MYKMKMKTPSTLEELKSCLKLADEKTYILAGGTDLIIKLRNNSIYEGTLIDISRINALKEIKEDEECIYIGAVVTMKEIIDSKLLQEKTVCLVEAAKQVGSTQIRNMATIGGNAANAFTGGDMIPSLMAVKALIKVLKADGTISLKTLEELIKSSGKNTLAKDEAIIEIMVPKEIERYETAFAKLGSRSTVTISKLNMAVAVKIDKENNLIEDINIVLGSLGTKAFNAKSAEEALKNTKISDQLKVQLTDLLVEQVDKAIPNRSSLPYKRAAVKGLADEIFFKLFEKTAGKEK